MNQEYKMKIPKEKIIEIYNNEYLNGVSSRQLGFKYGVVESYFSRWFRKLGLKTFQNDIQSKKYKCNENYFETIDTEDKAYWLGFLYADGYIQSSSNGNKKFGVSLSKKDIEHLNKLNKCLESNYPIKEYKVGKSGYVEGTPYCRLLITSKKMTDDLINKGCVEHKTNIIKFPTLNQVPKKLTRHFIRGYFDGDGSIYFTKGNKNIEQYSIDFLGTDDFLLSVMDIFIKENIIDRKYKLEKRKEGQVVSRFRFGGNGAALKFCHYIYDDATIYLDRKFERYQELLKLLGTKRKPIEHKCYICGDENSKEYDRWNRGGEYDGKIFCARHYRQLLKYGKITKIEPDVKVKIKKCDVCGDEYAKSYHIWVKDGEYKNKTMCRKHWDQMYRLGYLKDNKPAKHKTGE